MKKLAAALFLSSALSVAMAPSALAEPPRGPCNAGTMKAHATVPEETAGNMRAHQAIPHCDH